MKTQGVILAGGFGTRLRPLTSITNKHLLPVYDKPMILYPLETLKALGIEDILIISGGEHIGKFIELLGDGSEYKVNFTYKVQHAANGIADALSLAKNFIRYENFFVILGDNIYDNTTITDLPLNTLKLDSAYIFLKNVAAPERFGVPVFSNNRIVRIEEKPQSPKSDFAVTGLYCYPKKVFDIITTLKPSARGELEITDVNNFFIKEDRLHFFEVQGYWSDAGTFESLLASASWAQTQKKNEK